jgi:hypothetical protein
MLGGVFKTAVVSGKVASVFNGTVVGGKVASVFGGSWVSGVGFGRIGRPVPSVAVSQRDSVANCQSYSY